MTDAREKLIEAMARAAYYKRSIGLVFLGAHVSLWESLPEYERASEVAIAADALTALAEQGYAVVPREPTEVMQREGFRHNRHVNDDACEKPTCIGAVTMPADKAYRAMVAAGDLARLRSEDPTSA